MLKKILNHSLSKIAPCIPSISFQKNNGYCPCCESKTSFISIDPWFRDHYRCTRCKSIPRERALMLTIQKYFPHWKTLSIHESSPNKTGVSLTLQKKCKNYLSSHYFPDKQSGESFGGYLNQDLEKQTFTDESFDLVITQDVFEHIFDPDRAFQEICRTLKPGGAHIFSVPIINRHAKSEKWATKRNDGGIEFTNMPEYHSNPVDPKGSPVTMHWGFDIVDCIRAATGMETIIEDLYDLNHGLSARFLEIFVSKK